MKLPTSTLFVWHVLASLGFSAGNEWKYSQFPVEAIYRCGEGPYVVLGSSEFHVSTDLGLSWNTHSRSELSDCNVANGTVFLGGDSLQILPEGTDSVYSFPVPDTIGAQKHPYWKNGFKTSIGYLGNLGFRIPVDPGMTSIYNLSSGKSIFEGAETHAVELLDSTLFMGTEVNVNIYDLRTQKSTSSIPITDFERGTSELPVWRYSIREVHAFAEKLFVVRSQSWGSGAFGLPLTALYSIDKGTSWEKSSIDNIQEIEPCGDELYAFTTSHDLYRSGDGISWQLLSPGLGEGNFGNLQCTSDTIAVSTRSGIFKIAKEDLVEQNVGIQTGVPKRRPNMLYPIYDLNGRVRIKGVGRVSFTSTPSASISTRSCRPHP